MCNIFGSTVGEGDRWEWEGWEGWEGRRGVGTESRLD